MESITRTKNIFTNTKKVRIFRKPADRPVSKLRLLYYNINIYKTRSRKCYERAIETRNIEPSYYMTMVVRFFSLRDKIYNRKWFVSMLLRNRAYGASLCFTLRYFMLYSYYTCKIVMKKFVSVILHWKQTTPCDKIWFNLVFLWIFKGAIVSQNNGEALESSGSK